MNALESNKPLKVPIAIAYLPVTFEMLLWLHTYVATLYILGGHTV